MIRSPSERKRNAQCAWRRVEPPALYQLLRRRIRMSDPPHRRACRQSPTFESIWEFSAIPCINMIPGRLLTTTHTCSLPRALNVECCRQDQRKTALLVARPEGLEPLSTWFEARSSSANYLTRKFTRGVTRATLPARGQIFAHAV